MLHDATVDIRSLTAADWPAIETLFGPNGACGGCWCMWWRVEKGGRTWHEAQGEPNRERFRALVEAGAVHGVLAFVEGAPVGWCNVGPRPDFPRLARSRNLQRPTEGAPWSVACFYIKSRWRRRGIGTRLLDAATEEAFRHGAIEVEGYPKPVRSGSAPGAFVWTGTPAMFAAAGYARVARGAEPRDIYLRRRP